MREDDVATVLKLWIEKAENDLKNAAHTLEMGDDAPMDTICFHTQQCVEKYLKALLVADAIPFAKTHDIGEVLALVPERSRPRLSPEEQRRLTEYATVTRYPGPYDPITLAEAQRAVEIARRVRDEVRGLLPDGALT